jgi:Na+-transporting methylmalonyl-CoA/oxaloacetate decarboxylase gamma subunit
MTMASAVLLESSDINIRGAGLGLFGGFVFTVLVVVLILLMRNMNMRIKRLPENFDAPESPPTADSSEAGSRDGA